MKRVDPLTAEQVDCIVAKMPEVIRAALSGTSLTGLDVTLTGIAPEELCHPLTVGQVEDLREVADFTRHAVEVTHLPEEDCPREGLVVFRVGYDIAWYDADGNAHAVQQTGVMGLMCQMCGGGYFHETLFIRGVEHFRLSEDGQARRPGAIERWLRRQRRENRQRSKAETVGEFLLEAFGAVIELVLEAIFDG